LQLFLAKVNALLLCPAALARSNGRVKRRLQFSLRTFLVAALVLPPAGYWILRSRQAANAAHDYLAAKAFYDVGTATFEQICDCSCRLRDAELAIPFANRREALIRYLNRVAWLEGRAQPICYVPADEEMTNVWEARAASLGAERDALEAELGIKAGATLGGAQVPGTPDEPDELPEVDPDL
jgi:hypothetical protein